MAERNNTIDFTRGIAMILVVWGHACQLVEGGIEILHLVIQIVQMPLFMFLSGFCAYYGFPIKNRKVYLKKKLLLGEIDYDEVHAIQKDMIEKSMRILTDALSGKI